MDAQLKKFFDFMEHDKKLSSNTLQSYKRDLKQYKEFLLSEDLIYNNVKEENIESYIEEQKQKGKKATSISRSLASIRAFYQYSVKEKKAKVDPTAKIKAPKIEKRVPNFLTSEEVVLLLEQPRNEDLKGTRDKAMLEFAYATGMKVTELIMLNVEDVDTKQGVVYCKKGSQTREIPLRKISNRSCK